MPNKTIEDFAYQVRDYMRSAEVVPGKNIAYSQENNAVIASIENGKSYKVKWTGSATVTLKKNSASGTEITSGSTSPLSFTADADYDLYFGSSADVTEIMVYDGASTDDTYEPYYVPVKDRISGNNPLATLVENCDDPNVHRNTWGGRYLGSSVTAEQFAQISAGTFHGLLVGDYWTIGGVDWVIADVDYWLHTGNTECTTHHLVIVPRDCLYNAKMNDTDIVTGAYVGSKMYTDNLATAGTTIETAFGLSHILSHKEYLANAITNNIETAHTWVDSKWELMNESMVYGGQKFHNQPQGISLAEYHTIDKSQLAVFRLNPGFICATYNSVRNTWWLRDVVNESNYSCIGDNGSAARARASLEFGVRPAFGIIG